MREDKRNRRAKALHRRESLPGSERSLWSRFIQQRVLQFSPYLLCPSVALYSPKGNEVATEEIRDHALSAGKKLFYPKLTTGENCSLIRVETVSELAPGRYGILEPVGERTITDKDRDGLVVFVPGIAFDLQGNRLGRGGGWYDRLLRMSGEKARVVALAYEFQIEAELPAQEWDQTVDHIITEERIIDCGALGSRPGLHS